MKIALVHELLTMRGGAERVLRILADMFPEAPIYTLLYDESALGEWFPPSRVRTSTLQSRASVSTNHHHYLRRFPAAVEAWDFSAFDLVISTSSAFAHGIITNGKPKHLCYVHSPARYLWDRTHDVQGRAAQGFLGRLKKWYLSRTFHHLRMWDSEAADRPDTLLAASREVRRRIELYWRRESTVVHPPIDDAWFAEQLSEKKAENAPLLVVSTLAAYKRIDLAIAACTEHRLPLVIIGDGPDRKRLEAMAGPTIHFLGYQDHATVAGHYRSARAVLFPGNEDFGLVPLEANACGTPVIAYRGGGALETQVEGKTALFFDEPTAASLMTAIDRFAAQKFDPQTLRDHAKTFNRATFESAIHTHIDTLMHPTSSTSPRVVSLG